MCPTSFCPAGVTARARSTEPGAAALREQRERSPLQRGQGAQKGAHTSLVPSGNTLLGAALRPVGAHQAWNSLWRVVVVEGMAGEGAKDPCWGWACDGQVSAWLWCLASLPWALLCFGFCARAAQVCGGLCLCPCPCAPSHPICPEVSMQVAVCQAGLGSQGSTRGLCKALSAELRAESAALGGASWPL